MIRRGKRCPTVLAALAAAGVAVAVAVTATAPTAKVSFGKLQAIADVNRDGRPDLLVVRRIPDDAQGQRPVLYVLIQSEARAFKATLPLADGYTHATAGDFDGDGRVDIGAIGDGFVAVLRGDGKGGFAAPSVTAVEGLAGFDAITSGDVTGRDGRADLVVASANAVRVFPGAPSTDASALSAVIDWSPQSFDAPPGIVARDVDGDGIADIVGIGQGQLVSLITSPTGPVVARATASSTGVGPSAFAVGYLNKDALPDVAVIEGGKVVARLGTSNGTFANGEVVSEGEHTSIVRIGNVDGVGGLDIVALGDPEDLPAAIAPGCPATLGIQQRNPVILMAGRGDGAFAKTRRIKPDNFQPCQRFKATDEELVLADLNGDGVDEATFTNEGTDGASVYKIESGPKVDTKRVGGSGRDKLSGTSANDFIDGRAGNDEVTGLNGEDRLVGATGDDRLLGSRGNDRLAGDAGNDTILGGLGDDSIGGGPGRDRLDGGQGDDTIRAGDGERDVVVCGPGNDTAFVDAIDQTTGCEILIRD